MEEIKIKGIDEIIYYDKCDNGMPIYMVVNDHISNFYITLNCRYGSVDTEFKLKGEKKYHKVPNGIAHFLEHVNFNEADGVDANEFFDKIGSNINAFTTFEFTAYEVFAVDHFKENLEHLLDYVNTPYFTKKIVEKEKGIILEEVNMGKNNPGQVMFYKSNEALFKNDKKKYLITGTTEDVKSITKEDLDLVYNNFYHPMNMFVVITGNFNPIEAAAIIKENQKKKVFSEYKYPIKKTTKENKEINIPYQNIEGNIEIPKLSYALKYNTKDFKIKDRIELIIALSILLRINFGPSSKLRETLLDNNLISGMSYSREVYNDYTLIKVFAETKYPDEVISKIREQFKNLEVDEETIKRRIKCNIASLITDYDDIEYVNNEIQDNLINFNKINDDMFNYYKNFNVDKINKIISDIKDGNECITIMNPKKNNS